MLNACFSLVTALLLQAAPPSPAATHPDLTGTWTLNREQSTPASSTRGPEGGREGEGGRGGGHGGGMGGHGGGMGGHGGGMGGYGGGMGRGGSGGEGGGRPDQEEMTRQRELMQELLAEPARFTIVEHEDKVTFAEPDGWTRTYDADGTKQRHQEMSGTVETKTRWDGAKFEIESKTSGGLTVTRTYEIADSAPRQLVVTTKLSGGRGPGDRPPMKHVYDESPE